MMLQVLLLQVLCLILLWKAAVHAKTTATITTNAQRYVVGTPSSLTWNYTGRNSNNYDLIAILYSNTVPDLIAFSTVVEMSFYVSTLNAMKNATLRDMGIITLDDSNSQDTKLLQVWPLNSGNYKAYLQTPNYFLFYAISDTFTVYDPILSTSKRSHFVNEPITFSWDYSSSYTGTGNTNYDFVGIYDFNVTTDVDQYAELRDEFFQVFG